MTKKIIIITHLFSSRKIVSEKGTIAVFIQQLETQKLQHSAICEWHNIVHSRTVYVVVCTRPCRYFPNFPASLTIWEKLIGSGYHCTERNLQEVRLEYPDAATIENQYY